MDLLYVKIRQTVRATSRERPQSAAEPMNLLTSEEIAAEITALHKPATSMPAQDQVQIERPSSQGSSKSSRKAEKKPEPAQEKGPQLLKPLALPADLQFAVAEKARARPSEPQSAECKAFYAALKQAQNDYNRLSSKLKAYYQVLHPEEF